MLLVVVLLGCAPLLFAYPSGAPAGQCAAMMPSHGVSAQTSDPPYTISVSKATYTTGEVLTVTVQANSNSQPFKGFLLEARSGTSTDALGTFQLAGSESELQLIDCTGGAVANNAVTHNSNVDKTSKSFNWTAPDSQSDIFFQATIVNVKLTLWTGVRSSTITARSSAVFTQANVLTSMLLVILATLFQ